MTLELDADTASPETRHAATTADPAVTQTQAAPSAQTDDAAAGQPANALTSAADVPPVAMQADWPEAWREKLAGGDEKILAKLQRMASVNDVLKWAVNADKKIVSGEYKRGTLPDDATPEQVAAFRKERGVPDAPAGYLENLPGGLVIGEDDMPIMDKYAEIFHENHIPADVAKGLIAKHYEMQQAQAQEQYNRNEEAKIQTIATLQQELGNEFMGARNVVLGMLKAVAPQEVQDVILNARGPDGVAIFNNPAVFKTFLALAREINPAATVVPNAGQNVGASIDDELNSIKAKMGDPFSDYWRGPGANAMQQRYRDLMNAKTKLASR